MTRYNTTKDQHVNGIGGHQIISYAGRCVVCGRRVYAIADAETPDHKADPDPRGHVDAYHARNTLTASEYGKAGPDVLTCYDCASSSETYNRALKIARGIWYDSDTCDGECGEHRPCYRLDLGGGGGVFLCRQDWNKEMDWRKERNRELESGAQFEILPWPGV